MVADRSPDIDDAVELYLHIWDRFGEDPFTVEHLLEGLAHLEIPFLDGKHESKKHLEMLVKYGLVNQDNGQYWVNCLPNESLSTWRKKTRSPEAIYQLVQQTKRRRKRKPKTDSSEIFEYENEDFVTVFVDENIDRSDLVSVVESKMSQSPTFDGIVIRSPADQIGYIQQLSDELCDAEAMNETELSHFFEIVTSNIRGEHKDDLEYHLYLRSLSYNN